MDRQVMLACKTEVRNKEDLSSYRYLR